MAIVSCKWKLWKEAFQSLEACGSSEHPLNYSGIFSEHSLEPHATKLWKRLFLQGTSAKNYLRLSALYI
jgi:hypothetical protein